MSMVRASAAARIWVGIGLTVIALGSIGTAFGQEETAEAAMPLRSSFDDVRIELPPLPAVPPPAGLAIPGSPTGRSTAASARGVDVPLPPAVEVTISLDDVLAGAIEARLADAKLALPPRFPRKEREALVAFYKARDFKPVWSGPGNAAQRAQSLLDRLSRAGEDALDPADYPVPAPGARSTHPPDAAETDIKLSAAAYLYARDARGGRIDPARISALMTPKLDLPALVPTLTALAQSADPGKLLAGFNPVYPGYAALREKLAELRAGHPTGAVAARPGRSVRATQAIAVLNDIDGPALAPLAAPPPARLEGDIVANMERWRWLPAERAPRAVFVNIPEFRLRLYEQGEVVHETRVIVGKPESPTPIVSSVLDRAVVNPSWHIPPSIMKNEILPGLARDRSYAARRGYEVIRRGNTISVRQPPGERNALGFIKFLFPNSHAVYLHDTPNRGLFASGRRAFSHGCVRVENPFRLADALLGQSWDERRLRGLIGRGERTIPIGDPLQVHLTYFTIDATHGLQTFEDLYGFNRRVRTALGLGA